MLINCFVLEKVAYKYFLVLFGILRLSLSTSSLKSPGSAIMTYSKSLSDPTSNGSTSSRGLLRNKTTRKILKKLVHIAIS